MEYKNKLYRWVGNFGNNSLLSDILKEQFDNYVKTSWECEFDEDNTEFYTFNQIIKIKEFFNILLVQETILKIQELNKNKWGKPFSFKFSSDNKKLSPDELTFNLKIKPCYGHEKGAEFDMEITSHQELHFWNE